MSEPLFISLIELIQSPYQFSGRHVRVVGFASMKFEGVALYVSEQDYRNAITKNAVWLDTELTPQARDLHEKYVMVEGVLDPSKKGHLNLYSSTLMQVNRLDLWSDPAKTSAPAAPADKP